MAGYEYLMIDGYQHLGLESNGWPVSQTRKVRFLMAYGLPGMQVFPIRGVCVPQLAVISSITDRVISGICGGFQGFAHQQLHNSRREQNLSASQVAM